MLHVGGKNAKKKKSSDSKRNFTVVMGNKEHGLYVSSSPSSAARKAVSKLCATDKKKKVQFQIREITQGSKKKTYGPYLGAIEKLDKPIELKGRIIRYKPVAKLSKKTGKKMKGGEGFHFNDLNGEKSIQNNSQRPQPSEREIKKQEGFKRKERLREEGLSRNKRKYEIEQKREQQEKNRHEEILKQKKIAAMRQMKINELFNKIKDEKKLFEIEIRHKVNDPDKIIFMTYPNYNIYLMFNGEKYIAFTSDSNHKQIWLESNTIDDFLEKLKKPRDERIVRTFNNKDFREHIKC